MFKKLGSLFALGAVLFALAGCTTFNAEGLAFIPWSDNMEVVGHFKESRTVLELFGPSGGTNLFNITAYAMKDKVTGAIWQEVAERGGNAAINIEVTYKVGFFSWLVNTVTGTVLAPARIIVEGDVVRMKNDAQAQSVTEKSINNAVSVALDVYPEDSEIEADML